MARVVYIRFPGNEREGAARFQDALVHFSERAETLFARRSFELRHRDELSLQVLWPDCSALDKNVGLAFDELVQLAVLIQEPNHEVIDG